MKNIFLALLLISTFGFSQNLNTYKYALVPAKFSFLKENNQHNLNVMTKLFMEKYKFETYLDNEVFPETFAKDNCNKVFVDVLDNSNFFTTRLTVVIKDCKNVILATSAEGKSKEKEFKIAYNQALRMAFENFTILKTHNFQPSQIDKETSEIVEKIPSQEINSGTKATISNPKPFQGNYYAQPIANGYQIIDSEPKVVMKIYKTSINDFYIAVRDNQNGVLFLKESNWIFEFYKEGNLVSEKIDVKF